MSFRRVTVQSSARIVPSTKASRVVALAAAFALSASACRDDDVTSAEPGTGTDVGTDSSPPPWTTSSGSDDGAGTETTTGTGDEGMDTTSTTTGSDTDGEDPPFEGVDEKAVIYQLVVRTFSNTNESRIADGTLEQNGVGKFNDIDSTAIEAIKDLGVTHIWLTGIPRQATMTDYSEYGLPADDADIVKGRAGSFYAVRDYYDVSPDYAENPANRLEEFTALVERIHDAGLEVVIDLVPNHVARSYGSVVFPDRDFGIDDDRQVFFSPTNDFFYLPDPPGQFLQLSRPDGWNPVGAVFDGLFPPEDGQDGRTPRVTGDNVTSPAPSANNWYETIKLNFGLNFVTGDTEFDPVPPVWSKFDDILAYWQSLGVDGFRADFAHFVPHPAWTYLITRAKERDPNVFFVAEAYEDLPGLLDAGFDSVYNDPAYDLVKSMYQGQAGLGDLDGMFDAFGDDVRGRYLLYLENHDERRIASPIVISDNPDDSGFGSADAGRQIAPLLYLYSNGPVLFYAGQEVGEPAAGVEGFGGDDGRTTIFDYWSMPSFTRWVNDHAYDGGQLTEDEASLRAYYRDVLRLCQDEAVRGGRYWGLRYINNEATHADANDAIFPFARFATGRGRLMLVAVNFAVGATATGVLRLPPELVAEAGLRGTVRASVVLDGQGAQDDLLRMTTDAALTTDGITLSIPDQRALVVLLENVE